MAYKKEKKITFVGKLNTSKGHDIYKDAITKIKCSNCYCTHECAYTSNIL